VRRLIRGLDTLLRRGNGVFVFWDHPDCVLRLQRRRAPHALRFPTHAVPAGAPVLGLHLWNEHLPPLPEAGADLAWATQMRRRFVGSLRAVAREVTRDPRLSGAQALGGTTVLLEPGEASASVRLMQRLGFTVMPTRHPLGRFGTFWDNVYAWGLMWTFNPATLRGRTLLGLRRVEMWMSVEELLRRYGAEGSRG
jgi:hypothetical protein